MDVIDRKAVKIRPMVSSDIPNTLDIWWADVPKKEFLVYRLGERINLSLIAEYEGLLVGFILAGIVYAGLPVSGVGLIFFIAVSPDYQGRGIGSMLIDTLKSNCNAQGISTIRALVPEHDVKIKKYFDKVGFRPSSIINFDSPV
jgi:ribosomal protein S18 acetylase RimI-like enzyme